MLLEKQMSLGLLFSGETWVYICCLSVRNNLSIVAVTHCQLPMTEM